LPQAPGKGAQRCPRRADHPQRFESSLPLPSPPSPTTGRGEARTGPDQFPRRCLRIARGQFRKITDAPPCPGPPGIEPPQAYGSPVGVNEAHRQPQQGTLPGPVRPEQDDPLARPDCQVHPRKSRATGPGQARQRKILPDARPRQDHARHGAGAKRTAAFGAKRNFLNIP